MSRSSRSLPEGKPDTESASPSASPSRRALRSIALLLARHEMRSLRGWYDEFDHDIMLPILLGEIALHNIGPRDEFEWKGTSGDWRCRLRPCNTFSIASAAGLPRETVRRKVSRLVELGWVGREENGHLFVSQAALTHFGSLLVSRTLDEVLDTADRARQLMAAG
ncbi:MAG: hypothetical protein GX576_11305 [Thauera phenolivorans]|uniref:HTH iclR-type domain-containing protein n=1 Tax=Thauera phenolivorans TaxID=1792543 RepID=A0A7X7R8T6_9RHOO|nr:hypothetical protein [Thauera phenolivorans]NLF54959.1 hypothetical protein [Thauera phenolivorans]